MLAIFLCCFLTSLLALSFPYLLTFFQYASTLHFFTSSLVFSCVSLTCFLQCLAARILAICFPELLLTCFPIWQHSSRCIVSFVFLISCGLYSCTSATCFMLLQLQGFLSYCSCITCLFTYAFFPFFACLPTWFLLWKLSCNFLACHLTF